MTKESFLRGAVILALASMVSRVIGLIYMVVLPRLIYDDGMGLYQLVKPIHYFAAVIAIAGMPVAISKLIAEKVAQGSVREVRRVFRLGNLVVVITGGVVALSLLGGASWFAQVFARDLGVSATLAILGPACFFLALSASLRGFFQGFQYMTPTAISQVADQAFRVTATIFLTLWLRPRGIEWAVTGVAWGFLVGELTGFLILLAFYFAKQGELLGELPPLKGKTGSDSPVQIIFKLLSLATPAVVATVLWPIMQLADSLLIPWRMEVAGFSSDAIRESLGHLGMALTLCQFPNIVTVALATSLVPAISEAWALKSRKLVTYRVEEALRMALVFGIPSFAALYVLATPLSQVLFGYPQVGEPLKILAIGTITLGLIQATTGILQGLGAMTIPVRNLLLGVVAKFALNYLLVAMPNLGILGAAWSTTFGWALVAALNFVAVLRRVGQVVHWRYGLVNPILATALASVVMYYLQDTLVHFTPNFLASLLALISGFILYFLLLAMWGTLEERDFHLVPGVGKGLGRFLQEWGFLRS